MALSADLLRGYTDSIILSQLAHGDGYGYQLAKNVQNLSGGSFELKEATLYTAFRRLENGGCIRSYWGNEQSSARRRYYAITPAGLEKLHQDRLTWNETRELLDTLLADTDDMTYNA